MTPDMKSLFVNIQHPGEPARNAAIPTRSRRYRPGPTTPALAPATIVITRNDGGVIGA